LQTSQIYVAVKRKSNCGAYSLLTPATLRWPTLSATSGKEGELQFFFLPSFLLAKEKVNERSKVRMSSYTSGNLNYILPGCNNFSNIFAGILPA
jgi:hypothetical protein